MDLQRAGTSITSPITCFGTQGPYRVWCSLSFTGMGVLSTLLMNDTLAIIGTPLMLYFAQKFDISPKPLLLAFAFAVTTGSVASPIGNPQNLLIALSGGVEDPFVTFLVYLAVPTAVSLGLAYAVLAVLYRDQFRPGSIVHRREVILDAWLAALSRLSLILLRGPDRRQDRLRYPRS